MTAQFKTTSQQAENISNWHSFIVCIKDGVVGYLRPYLAMCPRRQKQLHTA
jgi:hypothetical protein